MSGSLPSLHVVADVAGSLLSRFAIPALWLCWPREDSHPTHGYEPTREARDGGVREELAAGIGRVLINAQIVAAAFMGHSHRLSKK